MYGTKTKWTRTVRHRNSNTIGKRLKNATKPGMSAGSESLSPRRNRGHFVKIVTRKTIPSLLALLGDYCNLLASPSIKYHRIALEKYYKTQSNPRLREPALLVNSGLRREERWFFVHFRWFCGHSSEMNDNFNRSEGRFRISAKNCMSLCSLQTYSRTFIFRQKIAPGTPQGTV